MTVTAFSTRIKNFLFMYALNYLSDNFRLTVNSTWLVQLIPCFAALGAQNLVIQLESEFLTCVDVLAGTMISNLGCLMYIHLDPEAGKYGTTHRVDRKISH